MMFKILDESKSKDPLKLSFILFTLKYINDAGEVKFNIPSDTNNLLQ